MRDQKPQHHARKAFCKAGKGCPTTSLWPHKPFLHIHIILKSIMMETHAVSILCKTLAARGSVEGPALGPARTLPRAGLGFFSSREHIMLRGGIFAVVSLLAVTTAINVSAGRPGRPQVASSSGRAGDLGARPQLLSHPQAIQYTTEALKDRVDSLPGWGPINGFNMFSGWVAEHRSVVGYLSVPSLPLMRHWITYVSFLHP